MKEKRILYALIISFLFLFGYSAIISKFFPKLQTTTSSIVPDQKIEEQNQYKERMFTEEAIGKEKTVPLLNGDVGEFIATISPTGGYITKLQLQKYQEDLLYENIGFIPEDKDKQFEVDIREDRIIFSGPDREVKEYIIQGYNITIKTATKTAGSMVLFSNTVIPNMIEQRYQQFFYSQNGELIRTSLKKVKKSGSNNLDFIGARDRYFCAAVVNGVNEQIDWFNEEQKIYIIAAATPSEVNLYIGPQIKQELQPFGLEGVVHYGFFHGVGIVLMKLLYFFHCLTKSWGLSVILLAASVYCLLFPFTMKSTKAMKRMQELQPEIEALKQKYKDNPQKMNKETMKMYKDYKINPLGGCLPLVFQFPVFIALYQVLLRSIELKGESFLWIKDLSLPDRAFTLPFTVPFLGNYINILPICIIIISLFQQKFTTSSSSSSDQKKMGLFFAVFIGVIFYKFPACLVLYWFVQNAATLLYQMRLAKK
ncbi:MAG: membrane protein insertase YidC [Candidatus Omnitrophota bacterium]|nr:membrane protein insertase YidC [Candidatus Omnitrophota bacterium]